MRGASRWNSASSDGTLTGPSVRGKPNRTIPLSGSAWLRTVVDRVVEFPDRLPGARVQFTPGRCQRHPASYLLEQRYAHRVFQGFDAATDRRLRHAQPVRGVRDVPLSRCRVERSEQWHYRGRLVREKPIHIRIIFQRRCHWTEWSPGAHSGRTSIRKQVCRRAGDSRHRWADTTGDLRRRTDRRRHHVRDAGGVAHPAPARLVDPRSRTPRRHGVRKQRRVEQRRNRPRGILRTQLHARSRRSVARRRNRAAVPDLSSVLGVTRRIR